MTNPERFGVPGDSELDEQLRSDLAAVKEAERAALNPSPGIPQEAATMTEYRVVCADGSEGHDIRATVDSADIAYWRDFADGNRPGCGPHRVEQATVTRSEWRPV